MGVAVDGKREGEFGRALRAVFEGGAAAGSTDAQLVDRVASGGESARSALAALVGRHGPTVLHACRAGSRDEHDADDAFQAVFLVLARKAGSIRVGDSLAPWLIGVASRTTAAARVASARRRSLDRRAGRSSREDEPGPDADLAATIHEELGRLPDRYRTPLVLCDLEGLSHEEAACRLGWPVGTVKSRQARGRERLRGRLIRRGIAPGSALVTPSAPARAALPESLARRALDAAMAFRPGAVAGGVDPPVSARLARKAIQAMFLSRVKTAAWALLALGAAGLGAATIVRGQRPAEPVPAAATAPRIPRGSLLQFHYAADPAKDADAIDRAGAAAIASPPEGYRWARLGDTFAGNERGGLVIRNDPAGDWVLLKLDPQDVTEADLARVTPARDELDRPALTIHFNPDGARRFGELTRSRLPEGGGAKKYRLAVLVHGAVVSTPSINSEVREAAMITFGTEPLPGEVDRLAAELGRAAAANACPTATEARTQGEAIRLAREVDLPALAGAVRVTVERAAGGDRVTTADPKRVAEFLAALTVVELPPPAGERVASVIFLRGDAVLREVWVDGDGTWGFVRPGTSWAIGRSDRLRGLVTPGVGK